MQMIEKPQGFWFHGTKDIERNYQVNNDLEMDFLYRNGILKGERFANYKRVEEYSTNEIEVERQLNYQ
jgi:hypothetical protein